MPQLHLNQGPQDALLYDNSRSYFTNVGYTRTSNFQMELRDIEPQNAAQLGSTVNFIIPHAGDLLGPCDLLMEFNEPEDFTAPGQFAAWVETLGFAMIDRLTFSVGSGNEIEVLTGDQLNIMNELARNDAHRYREKTILKTGRPAVYKPSGLASSNSTDFKEYTDDVKDPKHFVVNKDRLIAYSYQDGSAVKCVKNSAKLIVPLGLFFTKHPGHYFPLCAIAGVNDVRIEIRFKTLEELMILDYIPTKNHWGTDATNDNKFDFNPKNDSGAAQAPTAKPNFTNGAIKSGSCKLRCHFIHLSGKEMTQVSNSEHVRLLRLMRPQTITYKMKSGANTIPIDLSFLHPTYELIITIRRTNDRSSSTSNENFFKYANPTDESSKSLGTSKNHFAYHGGGKDPNIEAPVYKIGKYFRNKEIDNETGSKFDVNVELKSIKLTLNGQERHPSLAANGIDRDYLLNRLQPMLHSNSSSLLTHDQINFGDIQHPPDRTLRYLGETTDRKEIYVFPLSLNPEGHHPSGSVNFSKVSHAKLTLEVEASPDANDNMFDIDVIAAYYNWVTIKDGRALTSFA